MSNSGNLQAINDEKEIKFDNFSSPTLNAPDGFEKIQAQVSGSEDDHKSTASTNDKKEAADDHQTTVSSKEKSNLGESEVADDDDGFKTPTSLDQKIPVITQCPPPPRKSRKRKPSTSIRTSLCLDLSIEVESLFHPQKKIQRHDDA